MRSLVMGLSLISLGRANPILAANLESAANVASEDCAVELAAGAAVAPGVDGASLPVAAAACGTEFAARAAGAVVAWAATVVIMWADTTTTPFPCGESFDLQGQTCFNFPDHSDCYTQCCQQQRNWCTEQQSYEGGVEQCTKDRACITPNIQEFSAEQLMFLRNDMDNLNDQYNIMIDEVTQINITQVIQNREWSTLMLACNNLLSSARDFMHQVDAAQNHVRCGNPDGLCQIASAGHLFDLNNGDTCFNFVGPCYPSCCESQLNWCDDQGGSNHDVVQCKHDRGCRTTPASDQLQATVCEHLTSCKTSMSLARDYITNLHDCATVMSSGGCTKLAIQAQFGKIVTQLNQTHTELEALESLSVGHGTHQLDPIMMANELNMMPSLPDLNRFSAIACSGGSACAGPFEVDRTNHTTGAASHGSSHDAMPMIPLVDIVCVAVLSSLLTLLALHCHSNGNVWLVPKGQTSDAVSGSLQETLLNPNIVEGDVVSDVVDTEFGEVSTPTEEVGLALTVTSNNRVHSQAILWAVFAVIIAGITAVVIGGLRWKNASSQHHDPLHQMMSGDVTPSNLNSMYWEDLSTSMSTISDNFNNLEQDRSCTEFLLEPAMRSVATLFEKLIEFPAVPR